MYWYRLKIKWDLKNAGTEKVNSAPVTKQGQGKYVAGTILFLIRFYLQAVQIHLANVVKLLLLLT
jgi:hypothetical protein